MMKKTLQSMLLVLTLCMFVLPVLNGSFITTVHADDDNSTIPEISIKDNKVDFGTNQNFGQGKDQSDFWGTILSQGRGFVVGISGIGALIAIAVFIISFMKLGTSAGNPQARTQALTGILWSGIAAAGLGSVTLITGLFYGALNKPTP